MTHPRCPECSSTDLIPIVYGMPGVDLAEAEERGEVILGGCEVGLGEDPTHQCRACGEQVVVESWAAGSAEDV